MRLAENVDPPQRRIEIPHLLEGGTASGGLFPVVCSACAGEISSLLDKWEDVFVCRHCSLVAHSECGVYNASLSGCFSCFSCIDQG